MIIGHKIIELAEVDSTNNYASKLLDESFNSIEDGTIILAKNQYSGKGQQGNIWMSEAEKNLTMSIILKPEYIPVTKSFYLTICTSLAIIDCFKEIISLKIKWPNDIYFDNKKTGGILIENSIEGTQLSSCIIGIGLNINQELFPDHLNNAASISSITEKSYDLNNILQKLIDCLNIRFSELKNGHSDKLKTEYLNRLIGYRYELELEDNTGVFKGVIKDVEDTGILVVEDNKKAIREYMFKEVEFKF